MDATEEALARWLAHGVTSKTHPVLAWAMGRYFHPLGIRAEALEAEPFSALESGFGEWWLRNPRWDPSGIDPRCPGAQDFEVLRHSPGSFLVTVDRRGGLSVGLAPSAQGNPAASAFWADSECGWRAARHSARAAGEVEAFVFAAAGMILAGGPVTGIYAGGDDLGYCEAIAGIIASAVERGGRETGALDGAPRAGNAMRTPG